MRISAKGRYALAAMMEIARQTRIGELASVVSVAEKLGISKIFLEQAVSQLKKGNLLYSVKGARGGYQLARAPHTITVLDVMAPVENTLLEKEESTTLERVPATEAALKHMVWHKLDAAIEECLSSITVQELLDYADQQEGEQAFMLNM
jgi:Rrf2 family protein